MKWVRGGEITMFLCRMNTDPLASSTESWQLHYAPGQPWATGHEYIRLIQMLNDSSHWSNTRTRTLHTHLYGADDRAEQADHAEELHPAQVLHRVLLTHVRDGVQRRTDQHQTVTQQDVWGWGEKRRVITDEVIKSVCSSVQYAGRDRGLQHLFSPEDKREK